MTDVLGELRRRSSLLTALAAVHAVAFLALVAAMPLDGTEILGVNRWLKPAKFAISIAIYLATIAWLQPSLVLSSRVRSFLLMAIAVTMTTEMVAIGTQAFRGTTSHFNIATVLDGAIFQTMGIAIAINTMAAAWMAVGAWRAFRVDRSGYQLGAVLGFTLFIFGSAIGAVIVANNAHTVGAADGGRGLPLVNWSTLGGDLRVAHFVGMHGLQGLPIIGAWLGSRAVVLVAVTWGLVTATLLAQALAGRPLLMISCDTPTMCASLLR